MALHSSSHGAAYRGATVRPLCGMCNEVALASSCPRCSTPLCDAHALDAETRCPGCEATFGTLSEERRRDPIPSWSLPVIYAGSAAVAVVGVPLLARLGDDFFGWNVVAAACLALIAGASPLIVAVVRRVRLRGAFLRETPEKRRLFVGARPLPAAPIADRGVGDGDAEGYVQRPLEPRSVAALVLALCFFVPLAPMIAAALARSSQRYAADYDTSVAPPAYVVAVAGVIGQVTLAIALLLS